MTIKKNLFPEFKGFSYRPILGGYNEGITRRDPSPVIKYNDKYYVWYSKSTKDRHGYSATIWYATSADGLNWIEQKQALDIGKQGCFDEHAVFTPSILVWNRRYYMSYTGVPESFNNIDSDGRMPTKTAIGIAAADTPDGPWSRVSNEPIISPSEKSVLFDSLRIDDSCFIIKNKKIYMYYKGRQIGHTPEETQMGLAVADKPEGPYCRYSSLPLINGGHEVCCWPHGTGVAALCCNVGKAANSLQYSEDGIHFEKVISTIPPKAPGPYREDNLKNDYGPGISWGISMLDNKHHPSLVRFDCNLKA